MGEEGGELERHTERAEGIVTDFHILLEATDPVYYISSYAIHPILFASQMSSLLIAK